MAGTPLPPCTTLPIKGARAFPPNSDRNNPGRSDIAIAGGRIVDLATDYDRDAEVEIIEARDNLVLPGFVNAHYHSHDALAKGTLEEVPLETWRLCPNFMRRACAEAECRYTRVKMWPTNSLSYGCLVCQSLVFNLQATSRRSFIRGWT
jgi:hypothetical protein